MKAINDKITLTGMALALSLSLACQRAPEQTATNNPPEQPAAAPAPAPPAAAPAPAAPKPAAPRRAPAKPSAAADTAPASAAARPIARTAVLEPGTALKVRTTNTLSTKLQKAGDTFEVSLAEPIIVGGREVVPKNTMLMGRVVEADAGGRVKGVASMAVQLNTLHLPDGRMVDIDTNNVSVEANTSVKKDAVKVGVGTAIGTAIGAIAGGKKGAGIGAATGAGAGTAVVLGTRGDAAEIPAETLLEFSLRSPATLPSR
jgi:hypothetical protein